MLAQAKAHLSELVAAAEAGDDVVITRRGSPVVRLVSQKQPKRRLDLDWLHEMTKDNPYQEDSGTFVRCIREEERY